MRYFIEGSNRYYFNNELMCVEFKTVSGKYKKCEIINDGNCLYTKIGYINEYGRVIYIKKSLSFLFCKYVKKIDCIDFVILYLDNDYTNINLNNVYIKSLNDYECDWVIPNELKENYKLSSSGLLYNIKLNYIEKNKIGEYHKKYNIPIHHLVWKYFNGTPIKRNYIIDHINNNINDNSITNLQMITQNENVKKERSFKIKNGNLQIHFNNKNYFLGKKENYTFDECEMIYNKALKFCIDGIIDNFFSDNEYIRYDFLKDKWKIIGLPKDCDFTIIYNKYFDSFDECKEYFDSLLEKYGLKYYKIGSKEYYLHRNKIKFEHKRKKYSFVLLEDNKEFSIKVINYFMTHDKDDFISEMDNFRKERMLLSKKQEKIKNINTSLINDIKDENYSAFNDSCNFIYEKSLYVFNIPYNGKYYYLGSIENETYANEIDLIIKENKYKDNFLNWLKDFKDNGFCVYKQKVIDDLILQNRKDSKGYYYFKNKNKWKSHITINGKEYLLGYFLLENEASYIYKESVLMLEYGIFDKWYKNIKEHRNRIISLFE